MINYKRDLKYALAIFLLLIIAGFVFKVAYHKLDSIKNWIEGEKTITYKPGEDPQVLLLLQKIKLDSTFNAYKDSVGRVENGRLQSEIDALNADSKDSERQVVYLGKKKTAADDKVDLLKPGIEKETAVNNKVLLRHPELRGK